MENFDFMSTNNDYNYNRKNFNSISYRNAPLNMTKSHSTNELFLNNNEFKYFPRNENEKNAKISQKYEEIPEHRIEEYFNDYYDNLYNKILLKKEKSINKNELNPTIHSSFSDLALALSPIEYIPSPKDINNNINSNNFFYSRNRSNDIYKNKYNTIDNNYFNKNINLPNDLLIEYDNKKRLLELRNKYLTSSSVKFLKQKDENCKNNIENNFEKSISKIDYNKYINNNNIYKDINIKNELYNKNNSNNFCSNESSIKLYDKLLLRNKEDKIKNLKYFSSSLSNQYINRNSEFNANLDFNKSLKSVNNMDASKELKSLLLSKIEDKNKSITNNFNNEQLLNTINEIKNKYNKLQNEFNNILNERKNNFVNEKDSIEHYLIEENNKLKNINNKFEMVFDFLISYINEINKYFKIEQIEYFKLKQNIINSMIDDSSKNKYINDLSEFLKDCQEKIIYQNFYKINESNILRKDKKDNYEDLDNLENKYYLNNKNIKNKYNRSKKISNSKNCNSITVKEKRNLSAINNKNKFINSSRISINSTINKTCVKNSLLSKNKKVNNLFKKKKSYKKKDKFWNENKLVNYS